MLILLLLIIIGNIETVSLRHHINHRIPGLAAITAYLDSFYTSAQQAYDSFSYYASNLVYQATGSATVAAITTTPTLCASEQNCITTRNQKTVAALEKLVGQTIAPIQAPRIALVASGGGVRAMIATLAFLTALRDIGIYDASSYISALSGSCWLVAPWLSSGLSLDNYKMQLMPRLQNGLMQDNIANSIANLAQFIEPFVVKEQNSQPISSVDMFGGLLAQDLLLGYQTNINHITLSSQASLIAAGNTPYPLYNAVIPTNEQFTWVTFSPHEIRINELNIAIPSWGAGRIYNRGYSTNFAPEPTLGFWLGTWGSAYAVNPPELLEFIEESLSGSDTLYPIVTNQIQQKNKALPTLTDLTNLLEKAMAENVTIDNMRVSPARINNFMNGLTNQFAGTPTLTFIDAGFACNLPLEPALMPIRGVNFIIIFDASEDLVGAPELHKAAAYAQAHGLPFPDITTQPITPPCTIFTSPDPAVPTIAYLSLPDDFVATHEYASFLNFDYNPQEFEELYQTAYNITTQSSQIITTALQNMISARTLKSIRTALNYLPATRIFTRSTVAPRASLQSASAGSAFIRNAQDAAMHFYIGHMYLQGGLVPVNYAKALISLEHASTQKFSPWIQAAACYDLGRMYEQGLGIAVQIDRARYYYAQAANQQVNTPVRDNALVALKRVNATQQKA